MIVRNPLPHSLLFFVRYWLPRQFVGALESLPHAALMALGCGAALAAAASLAGLGLKTAPTLLCLATGSATALLAYRDHRWRCRADHLSAQAQANVELEKQLAAQALSLHSQVEILSAMREVSRLTAEEGQLDRLSRKVFQILTDLLEADEMTLFLFDRQERAFSPYLHRVGEREISEEEIAQRLPGLVDRGRELAPVFTREFADETLYLDVPLIAEGEPLGVLRIGFAAEDPAESVKELEQKEYVVKDLAKHIALVVKAPILRSRALQDGLTGLYTKRHFEERLEHEAAEADRDASNLSLVMIDIDHFKSINDTHGHPTGDRVLRSMGQLVRGSIRGGDSAYRFGGEEIAVLLPKLDAEQAVKAAERLRRKIEKAPFGTAQGKPLRVTASFGVAQYAVGGSTHEDLVSAADRALYESKRAGRNRVTAAGPEKELDRKEWTADTRVEHPS